MMDNKRAIALVLPLALGACAATSVKGLQEREPVLVADSNRDVAAISSCINDKWLALRMTPRTIQRSNSTTLVVEQVVTYALPIMVVDLVPKAGATHVTMHQFRSVWSKQNRQRLEEVRACL